MRIFRIKIQLNYLLEKDTEIDIHNIRSNITLHDT